MEIVGYKLYNTLAPVLGSWRNPESGLWEKALGGVQVGSRPGEKGRDNQGVQDK